MLARSAASSLRAAVRPGPRAARAAVALRFNSTDAKEEPKAADEAASKLAELEAKLKEQEKEMQYLRADYQTMSRRVQEERTKASDFAIAKFARELVGSTHVLGTALKHTPKPIEKGSALGNLYDGVELTRKSILQTLAHHGVTPMGELLGTTFDPNLHEAIFQVPAAVAPKKSDGADSQAGDIIEVQKEGWMIKDRVLVPAQVGVVQLEE
ncbi:hypothetical protein CspeluHIS016_0210540 [Cutaneotrichosporon spelunceum]|uniref:GrpE protein homolog, mitochondrial n=1 Tax=Cutaneotrichosporon spelunceum TaxID=1672016 RepID=A0AAD3TSR8_9TREE|nr:hypothetical protein CspeluHIS016_0210540 [Cutaneotrichosporon spelunceum]